MQEQCYEPRDVQFPARTPMPPATGNTIFVTLQNLMKTQLVIVALLFIGLTACSSDTTTDQQDSAPAAAPAAAEGDKGTQVRIGGDGVNVETDKVDINISADSGTVRIGD